MTAVVEKLDGVLSRKRTHEISLAELNSDVLKRAARFWIGTPANTMRKVECIQALTAAMRDKTVAKSAVHRLRDDHRAVLSVFKRYGGGMSGLILKAELLARGIVKSPATQPQEYQWRRPDPVKDLREALMLIPENRADSRYWSASGEHKYPNLAVMGHLLESVEAAPPLAGAASLPAANEPPFVFGRLPGAVALDFSRAAKFFHRLGGFKTLRGGPLIQNSREKLDKLFAAATDDRPPLPQPGSLIYEILRRLDLVLVEDRQGCLDLVRWSDFSAQADSRQAWNWLHAWLNIDAWQDGIGAVPDHDDRYDSLRIDPQLLAQVREILVWKLCQLAHGSNSWLDLAIFLEDLRTICEANFLNIYWSKLVWLPELTGAKKIHRLERGFPDKRAYWLEQSGTWIANALLGTLVFLGLVEGGITRRGQKGVYCFRLTNLGREVFGAPEIVATPPASGREKFFTVQPNHEIVAYLDAMKMSGAHFLERIAEPGPSPPGPIATYKLSRDSIYQALETGLSTEQIRDFLVAHGRTPLPDNVSQALNDWSRKRDALVIRTNTALLWQGLDPPPGLADVEGACQISAHCRQLPMDQCRKLFSLPGLTVCDHREPARRCWAVTEEGGVESKSGDMVSRSRLQICTERDGAAWKLTARSILQAREYGVTREQLLGWLRGHARQHIPRIIDVAIRNWFSGPETLFLGDLLVLRASDIHDWDALLDSKQMRSLILMHIPPRWLICDRQRRAELESLLAEFGFVTSGELKG